MQFLQLLKTSITTIKKYRKRILVSLLLFVLLVCAFNYKILKYAAGQGLGQFKITWQSQNIDDVLQSSNTDNITKRKLLFLKKIQQFAIDSFGLSGKNNFRRVYLPTKDTIRLWVINAANPLELKNYLWQYPIIGAAPYKGFFNKELLAQELILLKSKNLDIDVGNVNAWSTLGWFDDPLMYSVLHSPKPYLAETVIHEMVHATIFVKDSAKFNEGLAEFIGIECAKKILSYCGQTPTEIEEYKLDIQQTETFNLFMQNCAKQLQHLYSNPMSAGVILDLKQRLLLRFCSDLKTRKVFNSEKTKRICNRILSGKNAYFGGFITYNSLNDFFKFELKNKFKNNIQLFLQHYKLKYRK